MSHCHLAQFFAMQQMAGQHPTWPPLRAVLEINEAVPHIYNHTGYKLTVYAYGLPTWRKQITIEGRPSPRGVANDLMGDVLREAALSGFCVAARRRNKLNRSHPNEAPALLPDGPIKGELLPNG